MERNAKPSSKQDRRQHSLDYLRKRSQHRVWWNSARIALRCGWAEEIGRAHV